MRKLLALFGLLLLLMPTVSAADYGVSANYPISLTTNMRFLLESDAPLSIQEARMSNRWESTGGKSDFGWSRQVHWFHVYLAPYAKSLNSADVDSWLIESNYIQNDFIDVFFFHNNKMISHQRAGDNIPFHERSTPNRAPVFVIPKVDSGQLEVYFRVQTEGTTKLPLNLWPEAEFNKLDQKLLLWHGCFFGAVIILVIYNCIMLAAVRDVTSIWYIAFLISIVFSQSSALGLGPQFLWPDTPEISNISLAFWPLLSTLLALFFTYNFLDIESYDRSWRNVGRGLIVFSTLTTLSPFFVPYVVAIALLILTISVATIYDFSAAISRLRSGMVSARFFTLAWFSLVVGTFITMLAYVGVLPFNIYTSEAAVAGILVQMALHSLAFGDKFNQIKQLRILANAEARAKAEFIAKMSHEIRTPMNGVLGLADLLRNTGINPQQKYYVDQIRTSGGSLISLINDVLDLAKLEADKMELEKLPFDPRLLVSELVSSQKDVIATKNIQLDYEVENDIPTVFVGDSVRLGQVLNGLLSHAVESSADCKIEISLRLMKFRVNKAVVQFEIKGTKLDREVVKLLCSPFQPALSTQALDTVGIGLVICKQLAELMNASIGAFNQGDKGTLWCNMELPISDEHAYRKYQPMEEQSFDAESVDSAEGLKVLVAEDNRVNQVVIDGFLRQLGCAARIVNNGLEAVEEYRNSGHHYDVILMDCEMPEMDGFEATEYIRLIEAQQQDKPIPIIALSAHSEGELRGRCMLYGMNDIMTKPISLDGLQDLLSNIGNYQYAQGVKTA